MGLTIKTVQQRQFMRGINASTAYNAQPKGTVPRASNLVYTTRGSLRSADQNMGICTLNGTGPATDEGPIITIQVYNPTSTSRKLFAFQRDYDTQIAVPTGLVVTPGSGGTLSGTYYYAVSAIDGNGGETPITAITTGGSTGPGGTNVLTWTASTGAVGYNIYRGTSAFAVVLLQTNIQGTTFTDTGFPNLTATYTISTASGVVQGPNVVYTFTLTSTFEFSAAQLYNRGGFGVGGNTNPSLNGIYETSAPNPAISFYVSPSGTTVAATLANTSGTWPQSGTGGTLSVDLSPPVVNTTQTLSLLDVSNLSFSKPTNVIFTFPSGQYVPVAAFPQGAVGNPLSGFPGGSVANNPSAGGILGQTCPIPDMVAFAGLMILILGNGVSPYSTNGTNANTIALANTFTGAFPSWVATTVYSVGDIIQPDTPNGHIYTCIQAGTSGTGEPTFPTGSGQTVTDHTVIWQEDGSNATPAPRGAAHAINHAGSLWLWNTQPTNTSDNLDGPSVLKMSDANNPNSWNPINTAYVGKDDGQQGMGIASFTIAESGIPPEESLVLFKEFSTYQVLGVFGATDFAIQQAQTNLGCIAPRTIKFVPGFGIVRLSHLGFAVFDGVRDRLISEEIRPYLFGDAADISQMDFSWAYTAKADLTAVPPMYCCAIPVLGQGGQGQLTRLCCYDLVLKAWTIIDIPFGISAVSQLLIPGSEPVTVFGGWLDGMISRWMTGDQQGWQAWLDPTLTVHQGSQLTWSVRTPSLLGASATDRVLFRRFLVQGNWQGSSTGGSGQPPITVNSTGTTSFAVSFTFDNSPKATTPVMPLLVPTGAAANSSIELWADLGTTSLTAYATLTGTQALGGAPFEIAEFDWQCIARPTGALSRV